MSDPRPVLVTGGGGFLGLAIVRRLHRAGRSVRTFSRGHYDTLSALGVDQRQGDLADRAAVHAAAAGCATVYHVAAKAGVFGPPESFERANVEGTEHVITACERHGVERLVYTSSPSVVFSGEDEAGIDETHPYPAHFLAHYPRTKAIAERAVLGAARGGRVPSIALRPHLIWGPGDPHLVPRILERARAGRLRLVGGGANRVDSTYIDNAADAHLLAEAALAPGSPVSGRAYFISNGEPMPIRELIDGILAAADLPPVRASVGPRLAYWVGGGLELAHRLLGRTDEPIMTRFVARQLATDHWYDLSAARRDLGYQPKISIADGLARLGQALRDPPGGAA